MDIRQSIRNQTLVSITLANHLLSNNSYSNIVFSPLSIQVALSLIAAGAKGETLAQLLSFLKTNTTHDLNSFSSQLATWVFPDGSQSGGPRLSFTNGLWVEQTLSLKPSFKQVVDTVYNATFSQVDFINKAKEVPKEVNSWAEKQTNGLIKEILPADAVDDLTRLIFANAIYFKGAWSQKFDQSKTKDFDFHLLDGSKVQVPFMTSKKKQLVNSYNGFKVLGLPYLHGEDKRRFTMYFFLPDAKDGLPSLVQKVASESDFLDRHIPQQNVEMGEFLIPKFKISFGFKANEMLEELGLELPFKVAGDLTEMVEPWEVGRKLFVSSIHHESFVEVNEEGTEAAAVTAVVFEMQCLRIEQKVDFVADHPFLFVIKEDMSGVVLFIGQVVNPSVN